MPSITINGHSLEFIDTGEGFPVLLGHSYLWTHSMWQHQIDSLAAQGFRCIVPDLWGHGLSGANPDAVKTAVPGLIKGLESKSSELRKASATAIGRIGSKNAMIVYHAVPRLAKALKNDDWYIHVEVVKALGYIGSNKPVLVKPHLALIKNRTTTGADQNIRKAAEWALKKAGGV